MSVSLTDITTGEVDGRGFYDELMRTSKAHLKEEFEASRITGVEYSTVYLGAMNANLSTAASVIMQYELVNIQQQTAEESLDNTKKQGLLLDAQLAQATAQTNLLVDELTNLRPEQLTQLQEQIDLLQTQDLGQLQQTKLLLEQTAGQVAQNLVTGKQEDLVDEQIKTEATNTVDATSGLAFATLTKTNTENSILAQKKLTEDAQTIGTAASVGGLIGAEMALKEEQKESFVRDAEQKAAKFYADVFSIIYSTSPADPNANPVIWGLDGATSTRVMQKVVDGIGA